MTNKSWNQILELFHKPQTTNHKPATIHPHCKIYIQQLSSHPYPLLRWVLQVQVHMSGLTTPSWTFPQSRTRILCTNFYSLSDSLTLDLYPNFNAAPGQAEKLLRINKDWTTNPPDRPDNQQANPMLTNDNCTYRGGCELVLGFENKLPCQ